MTDLQEFEAFFSRMGVAQDTWNNENGWQKILTVAQAHFIFSEHGEYMEVKGDTMGGVYKREAQKVAAK